MKIDLGGGVHKIGLQFRNTNTPGSTKFCRTIGEIERPKTVKGKIDCYENCWQLFKFEDFSDMYGLHQSLATQLYKLEHSCIVKIGDGHNYTCLEMDPDPETDGSFAEPEFACFSFSYEESSKLLKDRLHIPSSSFVDAGQTSDSGFTFDASQIIAAKGKWVPIRTGDYITHMAKIEAVHNWRDLEMNSNTNAERNQQNKEAPCWSVFDHPDAFGEIMSFRRREHPAFRPTTKPTSSTSTTTSTPTPTNAHATGPTEPQAGICALCTCESCGVYTTDFCARQKPASSTVTTTTATSPETATPAVAPSAPNIAPGFATLTAPTTTAGAPTIAAQPFLSEKDLSNFKLVSLDCWRAVDCVNITRSKEGKHDLRDCNYSLQLKIGDLQEIFPPVKTAHTSKLLTPFTSSSCTFECYVVVVEASDVMGLNAHRGKQAGGNQTCMCPLCDATRAQIQKGPHMGKTVTKDQCAQWYEVFEQVGMKRPAQRANVVHKSIYVPKHTCPVPLHVMLGIVNDIRGMVNNLLQKIDGHNKKDVASKTKKMDKKLAGIGASIPELRDSLTCKLAELHARQSEWADKNDLMRCMVMSPAELEAADAQHPTGKFIERMLQLNQATSAVHTAQAKLDGALSDKRTVETELEELKNNTKKGAAETAMHEFLDKNLGINEAQFHGGDWQGNQCRKFIGTKTKKGKEHDNWRQVLTKLKELAIPPTTTDRANLSYDPETICKFVDDVLEPLCEKLEVVIKFIQTTRIMDDDEVEAGCSACVEYVRLYRELLDVASKDKHALLGEKTSIIPKMHILEVHIPEFARAWHTVGFFGEDVIETLHKDYNEMDRRFCSVRATADRMSTKDDFKNITFEQACKEAAAIMHALA